MGELVELDVTTVEESVTVNVTEEGAVQVAVFAEKGDTGPAGPNSVTSATTSDGTAELVVDTLSTTNFLDIGSGNIFFGDLLAYNYETELSSANHRAALGLDDMALLPNDGTATIDVLNATVQGTLTADHIHGNLAGSVYAHIRAGENLAKGDPVYISGSHGSGANLIAIVSKADAANAAKMPAVGVMDAAVANNTNGHMVITGTITELNTNAFPVNTVLYVATGGGWTSTPPAANSQAVAIVERSNANNGAVIVKVNGLGSSGGNGAADANKLARYSTAGTLPITNIGGLGTGVGTFLETPTSANLALALTDENGTGGGFVRAEGATLTSPSIAGTAAFTGALRPTSNALNPTMADGSLIARQDFTRDFTSFYIRNQMAWEAGPWVTTGTGARNTIDGNNLGGMRIIGTTQPASASSLGAGIKYPDGAISGQTMIRFVAAWHARFLMQNYFSLNSAAAFIFGVRNMAGFWSNSSIGLYHVPQPTNTWAAINAYAVGDRINVSGIVQIVSTAGISGASEPAFNATRNGTTSDGTVTWRNLGPHTSNKWALGLVDAAGAITLVDTGVAWVSINAATTLLSIRSDGTSVFASVNASTEVSVARGSLSAAHPYILARQDIVGAGEISGLLFTFEKPLQF